MKKILVSLLSTIAISCTTTTKPQTSAEFAATSVRITNVEQNSGGSGVILKSTSDASYILTNRHVCGLLGNGGYVITTQNKTLKVELFKPSKTHDLCIVKVNTDLGVSTTLASEDPGLYSDILISGHPSLLPHVLSKGTISEESIIEIIVGVRQCTKEEFDKAPLQCIFAGYPIVDKLPAQFTSALIAPGSSGSGVFNTKGELVGLAFAGQGRGLSFGFIVPYAYLAEFVYNEAKTLPWTKPANAPEVPQNPSVKLKATEAIELPLQFNEEDFYDVSKWKTAIEHVLKQLKEQGSVTPCENNLNK